MRELLKSVLELESESGDCTEVQVFLLSFAENMGWKVTSDKAGNIYVTKGESDTYPCVVAHMDTVHSITNRGTLIAIEPVPGCITGFNTDTMEQSGIGGDDKCGIYAALRALISLPACKAAFFIDEEVGCVGSHQADMKFFKDCRFILQADRRGGSDWVTNISGPLGSAEFQTAVAPFLISFGYAPVHGAMSDVMALRDGGVGVSCANMSAGYHAPHTPNEWIDVEQLENCVNMIVAICESITRTFPFTAPMEPYSSTHRQGRVARNFGFGGSWKKLDAQGESQAIPNKSAPLIPCDNCFGREATEHYSYASVCKDCAWELQLPDFHVGEEYGVGL